MVVRLTDSLKAAQRARGANINSSNIRLARVIADETERQIEIDKTSEEAQRLLSIATDPIMGWINVDTGGMPSLHDKSEDNFYRWSQNNPEDAANYFRGDETFGTFLSKNPGTNQPVKRRLKRVYAPIIAKGEAGNEVVRKAAEGDSANKDLLNSGNVYSYVIPVLRDDNKFSLKTIFGTDQDDDEPIKLSPDKFRASLLTAYALNNHLVDPQLNRERSFAIANQNVFSDPVGMGDRRLSMTGEGGTTSILDTEVIDMLLDDNVPTPDKLNVLDAIFNEYLKTEPILDDGPRGDARKPGDGATTDGAGDVSDDADATPAPTPAPTVTQTGVTFNKERDEVLKAIEKESNKQRRISKIPSLSGGSVYNLIEDVPGLISGSSSFEDARYPVKTMLYNYWKSKSGNQNKSRVSPEWKAVSNDPEQIKQLATEFRDVARQEISNAGFDLKFLTMDAADIGDVQLTGGGTAVTPGTGTAGTDPTTPAPDPTPAPTPAPAGPTSDGPGTTSSTPIDPATAAFQETFPELVGKTDEELRGLINGFINDGTFLSRGFSPDQIQNIRDFLENSGVNTKEDMRTAVQAGTIQNPYLVSYVVNRAIAGPDGKMSDGTSVTDATNSLFNYLVTGDPQVKSTDLTTSAVNVSTARTNRLNSILRAEELAQRKLELLNEQTSAAREAFLTRENTILNPITTKLPDLYGKAMTYIGSAFTRDDQTRIGDVSGFVDYNQFNIQSKNIINNFGNHYRKGAPGVYNDTKDFFLEKFGDLGFTESDFTDEIFFRLLAPKDGSQLLEYRKDIALFNAYQQLTESNIFGAFWPFGDRITMKDWLGDFPAANTPANPTQFLAEKMAIRFDANGFPLELVIRTNNPDYQREVATKEGSGDLPAIRIEEGEASISWDYLIKNNLLPSEHVVTLIETLPAAVGASL